MACRIGTEMPLSVIFIYKLEQYIGYVTVVILATQYNSPLGTKEACFVFSYKELILTLS